MERTWLTPAHAVGAGNKFPSVETQAGAIPNGTDNPEAPGHIVATTLNEAHERGDL